MARSKKRKIKPFRLILVLIVFCALIFGCFFLGYKLFIEKDDADVKPANNQLTIKLEDYKVYYLEGFDFNFVIANINITSDKAFNINLTEYKTDEGISLGDSNYYDRLLASEYKVSFINNTYVVRSDNNSGNFELLIPFNKDGGELKINKASDTIFVINLDNNKEVISNEKPTTDSDVKGDNYDLFISDAFVSTMMTYDGEEYEYPDQVSIFTFEIEVKEADQDLLIEDAEYIQKSSGEVFKALDTSYSSYKISNIIGERLVKGQKAALFFEVFNDNGRDFAGVVRIKFSNNDSWLELIVKE